MWPCLRDARNTLFPQREAPDKDPVVGAREYFEQIIQCATCLTLLPVLLSLAMGLFGLHKT